VLTKFLCFEFTGTGEKDEKTKQVKGLLNVCISFYLARKLDV
jgi:hypothetical protein